MARSIQLRAVNSPEFLRELHHFLWMEPQCSAGLVDAGWNCRDHALATGLLLASFGHRGSMLASGEAVFVRGAKAGSMATSFSQKPHNWLVLEGVGAIDLSIKSDFTCAGDRYRLPITSVFASVWQPRGRGDVYFLADVEVYRGVEQELLRRRNHATAAYLAREYEHLHAGHVTHSAGWNSSQLTKFLDQSCGDPCGAYAALVLHLRAFLLGEAPRLGNRPFHVAWEQIVRSRAGAIERVLACVEPYLPRLPEPLQQQAGRSVSAERPPLQHAT